MRYERATHAGTRDYEHRQIAAIALGRPLKESEIVHHADGSKDNVRGNLVICQDRAYHNLLHQRLRAFQLTGDPNKRKCKFCKQYGYLVKDFHNTCRRAYRKERYAAGYNA